MPSACGYACYQPCLPWCRRGTIEGPVAVNALKRAVIEHAGVHLQTLSKKEVMMPTGHSVAIVGSGPAGLTAGYYLAKRKGHGVTVFESHCAAGGQLQYGIPPYKLPRKPLESEIAAMTTFPLRLVTGTKIESLDRLFSSGYEAIFIAVGSAQPKSLGVEGESLHGVVYASTFLQNVARGRTAKLKGRVVVLGGDNVAVDSARCAVRLGASEVVLAFEGTREEAPALDFELAAAEAEGVMTLFQATPEAMEQLGRALTVRVSRPQPTTIEAETVLISAGHLPPVPTDWGIDLTPDGLVEADPLTLATHRPAVFAGGDCVTGPSSIVQAMAHGRRAAQVIDTLLGGDGDIGETFAPPPGDEMQMPSNVTPSGQHQTPMREIDVKRRTRTFDLVERGYSKREAAAEARRCVRCDLWRTAPPTVRQRAE